MINRFLIFAFLILIWAGAAFAQTVEQQAIKIRGLYQETNNRIEAGLADNTQGLHYAAWTIGGERDGQQWSGVGTMRSADEFYFDCEPVRVEECGGNIRKLIRKIVSSYSGATDLRTRSEYLFNLNGELVFAFTTELIDDEANEGKRKTMERRFYFAKNKLIRIARDGKNIDAKFTAEDMEKSNSEAAAAKRLQNLFALMFSE